MSIWDVASRMANEEGYVKITKHVLRDMYDEAFADGKAKGVLEGFDKAFQVISGALNEVDARAEDRRAASTQG